MMGYSNQSKGYNIWCIETSKLIVSRGVIFGESSVDPDTMKVRASDKDNSNVVLPER